MINSHHLRSLIVDPTLKWVNHYSINASDLVMGTFAKESELGYYLKQVGGGPALGIGQCEPTTGKLVVKWVNKNCSAQEIKCFYLMCGETIGTPFGEWMETKLIYNLRVQTLFCRYLYLSIPKPLPKLVDFDEKDEYLYALGEYWDKYYNRNPRVGTAAEFVECYHKYVEGK